MSDMSTHHSLVDIITSWKERECSQKAITFLTSNGEATSFTYRQLYQDTVDYSLRLQQLKIVPGELVGLLFDHSYEVLTAFLGAVYLGIVPSILPYFSSQRNRQTSLEQVQTFTISNHVKTILTTSKFQDELTQLLTETACRVCSLSAISPREISGEPLAPYPAQAEDTCYIQFSSGTTGKQKGVVLTHRAILANIRSTAACWRYTDSDVSVSWLPLYHDMGLFMALLLPLCIGASVVLMPPFYWVRHPKMLLWAIHSYNGTISWMPNFAFNHCVRNIRDHDVSGVTLESLRLLGNGSELVDPKSLNGFSARFASYGFRREALMIGYGMSEAVAGISFSSLLNAPETDWVSVRDLQEHRLAVPAPHAKGSRGVVSCGCPVPGTEIAIADEHGRQLSEREVGEVLLRGNCLFSGYYQRPDLTDTAFRDGWFRTGDIGYIAEGQLYVCDRKKDLIIAGGQNLYPGDIEAIATDILGKFAGRAVAFGIRDESLGTEVPVLVCEMKGRAGEIEHERLARQISQRVFEELAVALGDLRFAKRGWVIKTTSGKLARTASRKKYVDSGFGLSVSRQGEHNAPKTLPHSQKEMENELMRIFKDVLGIRFVNHLDNFFTLGGNSLFAGKLLIEIEKTFDIRLPMITLFQSPTIGALAETIRQQNVTTPFYSLIPIQPQGTLPPLFFIYSLGQGIQYSVQGAFALANLLGKELPLYGIRYGFAKFRGSEELKIPPKRIESLAEHYIAEIQKIQPEGPYFLCGRSLGGVIAFEMACQLERQGKKVAFLGLLDTLYPGRPISLMSRFKRLFDRHMGLVARVRGTWFLYQRKRQIHPISVVKFYRVRCRLNSAILKMQWEPQTFQGKLTFFESEEPIAGMPRTCDGWEQYAPGGMEVITAPGHHGNMIETEKNVHALAEQLQACLRQAREHIEYRATNQQASERVSFEQMILMWEMLGKKHTFETGIVLYGAERDFWIQREAIIDFPPESCTKRLSIQIESHAPERLHPITLTVENCWGHEVHTYCVLQPGCSEISVDMQNEMLEQLKICCDTTFIPSQDNPDNPDTRSLGVRIVSVKHQ